MTRRPSSSSSLSSIATRPATPHSPPRKRQKHAVLQHEPFSSSSSSSSSSFPPSSPFASSSADDFATNEQCAANWKARIRSISNRLDSQCYHRDPLASPAAFAAATTAARAAAAASHARPAAASSSVSASSPSATASPFSITIADNVYTASVTDTAAAPGVRYTLSHFILLFHDVDGIEWALVEWECGEATWQTAESLRADMEPSMYEQLERLALRPNDSAEVAGGKELAQARFMATFPNARPRAAARRAKAAFAGPAASSAIAPTVAATLSPPSALPVLRCANCACLCPGVATADAFTCLHCLRDRPPPCARVAQHGPARAAPVVVAVSGERGFVAHVQASKQLDCAAVEAGSSDRIDITVVSYHAEEKDAQQHVTAIERGSQLADGSVARLVLVLSCWTAAEAQTVALRSLAALHTSTVFVTFRQPNLVPASCFDAAVGPLHETVVYSQSPQPLTFLAHLCAARVDCVAFTDCGHGVLCLRGPLRPMLSLSRKGARQQMCACGMRYTRTDKWKAGRPDVKRWRCGREGRAECVDLIAVPDAVRLPSAAMA